MSRRRIVVVGLGDTGVLTAIALRELGDVVGITAKPEFVSGRELGLRLARPEAWARDYRFAYDGLSTRGTYRAVASEPASPSARFKECYALFNGACQRLIDTGPVQAPDAAEVAGELWSAVHGFVSLEAAGHFAEHADPLETILRPMAIRLLVGMGDDPRAAERAALTALGWALQRTATQNPDSQRA